MICRANHQQASPLPYEGRDLLALTAFVAQQSRGSAIETGSDPQLAPFIAKGRELFMQRQGQLNLGCANCHDDNWDKRLAGSAITQAHPTGYPLYRLEWQSLGSLQRRLRACITGIRAQAYDYGTPELVELTTFRADASRCSRYNSSSDSTLKRATPVASASSISSTLLPTPENTMRSAAMPAHMLISSSH